MKYFPLSRRLAFGVLACAAASGSSALSLGRVQGLALVGRTVDISVPVLFDVAGESLPECAAAEVFYGDSRLRDDRVTVRIVPGSAGAQVRVQTSLVLDEPVVTIYLNVGCTNKSTRRLVLLAEPPEPQPEAPVRPQALPQAVPSDTPRPAIPTRPQSSARSSGPGSAGTGVSISPVGEAATPAPRLRAPRPAASAPVIAASVARKAPAAEPVQARTGKDRQPRLKLEPLDLSAPAGDPALQMSRTLTTRPAEAGGQQRVIATAMWRAMNSRPEDLLREVQRLESLENDLRSLRSSIQRNEASLADVRGQLQKAQAERYANPLVYALALLAMLAMAAAGWFWRRRSNGNTSTQSTVQWWRPAEDSVDSGPTGQRNAPAVSRRGALPVSSRPGQIEPSMDIRPEAAPAMLRPAQEFSPSMRGDDFRASNSSSVRALRAEELHDVQQEADFFISLGEYDRAIEVLRSHISTNPETSAVAWLDLLDIYHKLERRTDYDWVAKQFQHNYNAEVPDFDSYSEASAGLEEYENAIARITALWPSRRVLDVIEESIFRGPSSDGSHAFSLQAYRDLLLLHHVGTEVVAQEEDGRTSSFFGDLGQAPAFDPSTFSQTAISPLSALSTVRQGRQQPAADVGIGLDINLDEPLPSDEMLIGEAHPGGADSHMLDFDLPDIDTSAMKPKKSRN